MKNNTKNITVTTFNTSAITSIMEEYIGEVSSNLHNELLEIVKDIITDNSYEDLEVMDIALIGSNDYFIYEDDAIKFLDKVKPFHAIGVVLEFEQVEYGETYCDSSNPVEVGNRFIEVLLIQFLRLFIEDSNIKYIENDADLSVLIDWVNNLK